MFSTQVIFVWVFKVVIIVHSVSKNYFPIKFNFEKTGNNMDWVAIIVHSVSKINFKLSLILKQLRTVRNTNTFTVIFGQKNLKYAIKTTCE